MKKKVLSGKVIILFFSFIILSVVFLLTPVTAAPVKVGTWKTAQTIQPFFYQTVLPSSETIKVYPFTNPADQKSALLANSLDMCGTTLAHAIHSASRGEPVVIVAALCNKCSALTVKADSSIKTVSDLKHKTIGYVPGTMHEILLLELLLKHGIKPDKDVRLIRVDFFDMGTALAKGNIDAFLSGEPFPTLAVNNGFGKILSYPYYADSIGTINAGMLVTQKMIEKDPETVQKLVTAHAKATDYLTKNKTAWLEKASWFGVSKDILQKAQTNMELAWYMDETFIKQARVLGERMLALGLIKKQPDYNALFDLRFVQKAKKELENQNDY